MVCVRRERLRENRHTGTAPGWKAGMVEVRISFSLISPCQPHQGEVSGGIRRKLAAHCSLVAGHGSDLKSIRLPLLPPCGWLVAEHANRGPFGLSSSFYRYRYRVPSNSYELTSFNIAIVILSLTLASRQFRMASGICPVSPACCPRRVRCAGMNIVRRGIPEALGASL